MNIDPRRDPTAFRGGEQLLSEIVNEATPGGVSEAERKARRTAAYRLASHEALPNAVRVAAAAVLEAIAQVLDRDRARAAVAALALTA
ncbi:hypothetical protein [Streptomyces flaveolus]|uniref:hypothetical protein n=1 Tax=Streptomyces flaveolus TaxID=67297 RepID=UPI00332323EF